MGLAVATVAQIRQPGRLPRKSWCHLMWNSRVLTKNWSQKLLRRWRQICVLFATVFGNFPAAFGRWRQGLSWGYFPQEATHRKVRFSQPWKLWLKVCWSFHSCFLWQSSRPSEIRSEHAVGVFGLFQVVPSCSKLFQVVPSCSNVPSCSKIPAAPGESTASMAWTGMSWNATDQWPPFLGKDHKTSRARAHHQQNCQDVCIMCGLDAVVPHSYMARPSGPVLTGDILGFP